MKRLLPILRQNKKIFTISLVVLLSIGTLIYLELRPKQYYLTVSTAPATATISIDGEYAGVGSIQKRLLSGTYTISAVQDGYKPSERKVFLNDTTTIKLELSPKETSAPIPSIEKAALINGTITADGLIIGINRFDSLLYEFNKTGTQKLHDQPVATFTYQHPNIILIEKQNSRDFVVINIETGEKRRVSLRALEPLVSVALLPNSNTVYFLAKLDVDARTTTLFLADLSFLSPQEIAVTKATRVEALASGQVLLFEHADALDKSQLVISDTNAGAELGRIVSNDYTISTDRSMVLSMDSTQLALYNTQSQQVIRAPLANESVIPFFSKNNEPMIVYKSKTGITLEKLSAENLTSISSNDISELGSLGVSSVVGQTGDILILIDSTNKVWQIALP